MRAHSSSAPLRLVGIPVSRVLAVGFRHWLALTPCSSVPAGTHGTKLKRLGSGLDDIVCICWIAFSSNDFSERCHLLVKPLLSHSQLLLLFLTQGAQDKSLGTGTKIASQDWSCQTLTSEFSPELNLEFNQELNQEQ